MPFASFFPHLDSSRSISARWSIRSRVALMYKRTSMNSFHLRLTWCLKIICIMWDFIIALVRDELLTSLPGSPAGPVSPGGPTGPGGPRSPGPPGAPCFPGSPWEKRGGFIISHKKTVNLHKLPVSIYPPFTLLQHLDLHYFLTL